MSQTICEDQNGGFLVIFSKIQYLLAGFAAAQSCLFITGWWRFLVAEGCGWWWRRIAVVDLAMVVVVVRRVGWWKWCWWWWRLCGGGGVVEADEIRVRLGLLVWARPMWIRVALFGALRVCFGLVPTDFFFFWVGFPSPPLPPTWCTQLSFS